MFCTFKVFEVFLVLHIYIIFFFYFFSFFNKGTYVNAKNEKGKMSLHLAYGKQP